MDNLFLIWHKKLHTAIGTQKVKKSVLTFYLIDNLFFLYIFHFTISTSPSQSNQKTSPHSPFLLILSSLLISPLLRCQTFYNKMWIVGFVSLLYPFLYLFFSSTSQTHSSFLEPKEPIFVYFLIYHRMATKRDIAEFVSFLLPFEAIIVLFFGLFTEYGHELAGEERDGGVGRYYPFFQDVHGEFLPFYDNFSVQLTLNLF